MNKRAFLLTGLLASPAFALEVTILDAVYTTNLVAKVQTSTVPLVQTQSTTSQNPISPQQLTLEDALVGSRAVAQAGTDTFSVSASTFSGLGNAGATAESHLTFSPTSDGVAPITLAFLGTGFFSEGFIGLVDITTSQTLFQYSWLFPGGGTNIESFWDVDSSRWSKTIDLGLDLLDLHDYTLDMRVRTGANNDSQNFSIAVAGITPAVPEPETWAMMLLGLAGVGYARVRALGKASSPNLGKPA